MEHVKLANFSETVAPFTNEKEETAKTAKQHVDGLKKMSFWMNAFWLGKQHTGGSVARKQPSCKTLKTYHETNKEVFGTQLYTIGEVLKINWRNGRTCWRKDFQSTAIQWVIIYT